MKVVYIRDALGVKITYSCSRCGLIFNQRVVPNSVFDEMPDISMLVPVKCPCGVRQLTRIEGECELTLHPNDAWIGPQKVFFIWYIPTSIETGFVDTLAGQEVDPDAKV